MWNHVSGRGTYPHQLAFLLLIPLRSLIFSPRQLDGRLSLIIAECFGLPGLMSRTCVTLRFNSANRHRDYVAHSAAEEVLQNLNESTPERRRWFRCRRNVACILKPNARNLTPVTWMTRSMVMSSKG